MTKSLKTIFDLDFASNTISSCFFFMIIGSYVLIPAIIAQMFNPIWVIVEAEIRKCLI